MNLNKVTPEEVSAAMELIPTLWIEKYGIKTESGLPLEFEKHRFMYDMYNDMSPLQVILKPPQIGATVKDILKSFYVAKKLRKDIIYTLPTQSDVQDMAGGKINRLVAQNPILNAWVKDHDTVEQKSVGDNIIYYRGTFSTKQAMMVASSLNIHDEVDASDAGVITQYETRLQAQADGWRWYFSHPSLAGHGVDIYWQQSDKKEWFITCPHCKKEQILTWPQNIDSVSQTYICSECKGELPNESRSNGKWVKTSSGMFSGYHISQLMCSWITAKAILEAKADPMKDEQYFYNYVLGLPYVASENKITPDVILKNVTPAVNDQSGRIVIGVDTGLPIHFTVANKAGVFYYGTCKPPGPGYDPYDDIEKLLLRWEKSIVVADQGGDLIGIRKLQAKYPGRVFLCYYRKDRKSLELIKWGEGENFGIVVVDRNRMVQLIVEQFRDVGRIRLNGTVEDWKEFAQHFDNIYRTAKETPFGTEYSWERNGPDHFVHSFLYAMVGLDKYSEADAQIVYTDPTDGLPVGRFFNGMTI